MKVKKVINNSIICVVDQNGHELIVTGRGLGYQKQVGENVDSSRIEKVYYMEDRNEQKKLRELMSQIPLEDLELTEKIIIEIKKEIKQPLNESLLITLADHISFALKRKKEGIDFSNPLNGPIMCYYPIEYNMGMRCLEIIEKETGVRLNDSEGSFIALHIVNAQMNTQMTDIYEITDLIDDCVAIVENYYEKEYDRNSLGFSRFIVHLRYFVKRITVGLSEESKTNEKDNEFYRIICNTYIEHYKCAEEIARHIEAKRKIKLSDEELSYLTIHLKRINDFD